MRQPSPLNSVQFMSGARQQTPLELEPVLRMEQEFGYLCLVNEGGPFQFLPSELYKSQILPFSHLVRNLNTRTSSTIGAQLPSVLLRQQLPLPIGITIRERG